MFHPILAYSDPVAYAVSRPFARSVVSIDTAHIYVLCIYLSLSLSLVARFRQFAVMTKRTKYEGWNLRSADESIGSVVERPSVNSLSFSLIHGGRLCHRVQISTTGIPMFGRTFDSGIFVVDTKECRKRPGKFKSRRKEREEEEEGRQSTVIRSKGKIMSLTFLN